jgi:hypothetical protein
MLLLELLTALQHRVFVAYVGCVIHGVKSKQSTVRLFPQGSVVPQ